MGACAALALTLGIASPGCVEAESQFYIVTAAPVKIAMGSDPVCDGGEDKVCNSFGIGSGAGSACFNVVSALIPRANDETNHTETNRIILNQVDVRLIDSNNAQIDSFTAPANGFVDPNPPETSVIKTVAAPVLRTEGSSQLEPGERFIVGVILKGRTTGGIDIETPEYFLSGENGTTGCGATEDGTCCRAF